MSIPFSAFSNNAATRNNAAQTIANGLNVAAWPAAGGGGGGKAPTAVINRGGINVPATVVPAGIANQLALIAARWRSTSEAERRVMIDAYLIEVATAAGLPANPRIWLERSMGAGGAGAAPGGALFPANAQIGHGPLDYIWSRPGVGGPRWTRSTIVEAKRGLGGNGQRGQWQVAAQMATGRQVQGSNARRLRGILTDGRYWRFYQLDCRRGRLHRTVAYDANVGGQQTTIVRLTQKFLRYYGRRADIWPL
jgi:hypothetical protein